MFAQSTNMSRTILSADSFLAGFFSKELAARKSCHLPLSVFCESHMHPVVEPFYPATEWCPRLDLLKNTSKLSQDILEMEESQSELKQKLKKFLMRPSDNATWGKLNGLLTCHVSHHGLPDEITPEMQLQCSKNYAFISTKVYQDRHAVKLAAGHLIKDIRQRLMGMLINDPNFQILPKKLIKKNIDVEFRGNGEKIVVLSAHDSTLHMVRAALNLPSDCWPLYGAALAIELWELKTRDSDNNYLPEFFIKFRVLPTTPNATDVDPGVLWSLQDFFKLTDDLIYEDSSAWHTDCFDFKDIDDSLLGKWKDITTPPKCACRICNGYSD